MPPSCHHLNLLSPRRTRAFGASGTNAVCAERAQIPRARGDVVFTHQTALLIARTARLETVERNKNPFLLPDRPPGAGDIQHAARTAKAEHPTILFRSPVECLVRASLGYHAPHAYRFRQHGSHMPRGSIMRVTEHAWCVSPELAFVQEAARSSDRICLMLLGWELCGTYCTELTGREAAYDLPPLTSTRRIREFAQRNAGLRGSKKALAALRFVADGSASPRETMLALALGLPLKDGGHALGMPAMNHQVKATDRAHIISGRSSFRCDLCWPDALLDVEYQSREVHANEGSRIDDSRRANALASMGWTVVAITNDELDSVSTLAEIAKTLRKHLHLRYRPSFDDHYARHLHLRRALGLPTHP